ncbi:MAG: succinate dehydrogenase [Candidatus Limnocylindrales bacterium]
MAVTRTSPSVGRTPLKPAGTAATGFGRTSRTDWWARFPSAIGLGLGVFIIYALFSAFVWGPVFGAGYEVDGYLSPFFSPLIGVGILPTWLSPAILVLWIPLGFRTTCYAFRRAYYRSYFADPPACAVGEPRAHRGYAMEARFPFILQNLHRLFLYLQFIPLFFLWLDALVALHPDASWRFGVGNLILFTDLILLTGFSLSCHSLRHFVGGRLDCFSCTARTRTRHSLWQRLTDLNANHIRLAGWSLLGVAAADFYIRLLAIGLFNDPSIRL